MTRLPKVFSNRSSPAFITFIVAGDPDTTTCIDVAKQLIDSGADILELGMPFSDPVADGPTIQKADERTLSRGMTPDLLFEIIRMIRLYSEVPIVILTYYNIVLQRGIERFYHEAKLAGIDGILIVDMPPEESREVVSTAKNYGLDQIFLVAETTSNRRLNLILSHASGFLYLVSTLGVTGTREELSQNVFQLIRHVRQETSLPLAVGFGISKPTHVKSLKESGVDGIIVGSAIVDIIERHLNEKDTMLDRISSFVIEMKRAIEAAGGEEILHK